jgi:hypothetical protein
MVVCGEWRPPSARLVWHRAIDLQPRRQPTKPELKRHLSGAAIALVASPIEPSKRGPWALWDLESLIVATHPIVGHKVLRMR